MLASNKLLEAGIARLITITLSISNENFKDKLSSLHKFLSNNCLHIIIMNISIFMNRKLEAMFSVLAALGDKALGFCYVWT